MERLRWRTLGALFLIAGTISLVALRWWSSRGHTPIAVPVSLAVLLAVLAAVVVFLGLRVRRAVRDHLPLDPIGAARTLVLGQAAAIAGTLQLGYFAAQLVLALPRLEAPEPRLQALSAGAAIVAGAALVVAGLITQWCCRVPPEGEDKPIR